MFLRYNPYNVLSLALSVHEMMKTTTLAALAALTSSAIGQLPPGFTDSVYRSGLSQPAAMAFAPDGRLFVAEKTGAIKVIQSGVIVSTFATINVSSNSERGLLGIAFDPDFATNDFIYVYYTTSATSLAPPATPKNRVSRLTANGNVVVPGSETIIVDNIPSDAGNHNAGCLRFAPDGTLYISTGDGGSNANNSQNGATLSGKILRVNKDGSIPSDNPFFGSLSTLNEIFCLGLRNPFRFCFLPGTSTLFIGDVGASAFEEVNVGFPAANFGWPIYEGPSSAVGYVSPAFSYPHTVEQRASITGGCFMVRDRFAPPYSSSYFYADYVRDVMRRVTFNASNVVTGDFDFEVANNVVDMAEGPDGALYYLDIVGGTVRRIVYKTTLTDLTLAPTTVVGTRTSTGSVFLDHPAPAAGALIFLTSSNTSVATVPASVRILGGQTSKTFTVSTPFRSTQATATITATRLGVTQAEVLTVNPTPSADFISQSVPLTVTAGDSFSASFTFNNNGATTWTHATGYRLASYSPSNNTTWGTNRIFLSGAASIAPGGSHTFTATLTAPSSPGSHTMQWRMMRTDIGTFGAPTTKLTINVIP